MSGLDDKTWKEYLQAKKVIDSIEDKDKLDRRINAYERHKKHVLEKHYENVQKGGDVYLDKLNKRRKELYHLRKEKKLREKEEAKQLELARADRSKASGNPFGMAIHNLKLESSDSGSDTETECETVYCSTCPTTDAESVASEHPIKVSEHKTKHKKQEEINIPPPPKTVQNLFRRPVWA